MKIFSSKYSMHTYRNAKNFTYNCLSRLERRDTMVPDNSDKNIAFSFAAVNDNIRQSN